MSVIIFGMLWCSKNVWVASCYRLTTEKKTKKNVIYRPLFENIWKQKVPVIIFLNYLNFKNVWVVKEWSQKILKITTVLLQLYLEINLILKQKMYISLTFDLVITVSQTSSYIISFSSPVTAVVLSNIQVLLGWRGQSGPQ